jgi:hypothetical protein
MNIRDITSIKELAILSNLETLHAVTLNENAIKEERYLRLREIAINQLSVFIDKYLMKTHKKIKLKVFFG